MRLKLTTLAALLTTLLLSGCGEEEQVSSNTPERMTSGKDLYSYYCSHCHKTKGPGELLEHRDSNRRPLKNHELMMLMQFGDNERHRNMPTFMDVNPEKLQLIANYISSELTPPETEEDASPSEPATASKS